jgi:cardiolipin synthase A/B
MLCPMDWLEQAARFWPHLATGFDLLAAMLASGHALLHKRDTRAATLWIGIIWLLPLVGSLLYLAFGVNRIRRRAVSLGVHKHENREMPDNLGESEPVGAAHLLHLARAVNSVTQSPLLAGNQIEPLVNGDQAFPAMLAAIESAQTSLTLGTYIFDNDPSGRQFAEALGRAVKRGVAVRVLIDAAGARYSWPSIVGLLHQQGVTVARFLPSLAPWRVSTINLRNHRKLLVVDGQTAFTGGMNLRHGNVLGTTGNAGSSQQTIRAARQAVQDLHFRVTGPVVAELQEAFANDWAFATGETLDNTGWFPALNPTGNVVARVIMDGPDADFEKARWTLLAALAEAQTTVKILTPYFLPDTALIAALNLAALRGVRVDIILPAHNNLPFVHWASRALWWQVLERGCHVWLTPPPFDHSKLMIVDSHWVLLGSANWDARSLRLNFELNVECYGREFARTSEAIIATKLTNAREISLAEMDARPLPEKLRDAVARLFSPYL